jgi:hypothetical protein
MPALKRETARSARPRLSVVAPRGKRKSSVAPAAPSEDVRPRVRARADAATAARRAFRSFAVLVSVVAVLGFGRVWLTVQAAEASRDSSVLRRRITMERYRGDMLEVRLSALGSPSRIRAIADATMQMSPASKITQIDITEQPAARTARVSSKRPAGGLVHEAMDIAAGEAHVLLVGDVGLSTVR